MNALDAALLGVVLLSVGVGVVRGLVREVFGVLSLGASLVLAYFLGPVVLAAVAGPGAGAVAYLVACAVVFAGSLVALALAGRVLSGLLKVLRLGGVDRALGGLFGLARALLVTVTVLTVLVFALDPSSRVLERSIMLRAHARGVEWLGTHIPHEGARREFVRRWSILTPRDPFETRVTAGRAGHSADA